MSDRRPGEQRVRADDRGRGRGLLGLVLLLLAGLVGPQGPTWSVRPGASAEPGLRAGQPVGEPVADLLAPLGPIKAIVSSALWVAILQETRQGGSQATVGLAEALLAIHPDLDVVRTHLAEQLVVNEAARAPDDETHRALVLRGLQMLEDGAQDGRARIHGALGRLLVERTVSDPRFAPVARQYFGEDPLEIAIEELRVATAAEAHSPFDTIILVDLLVSRGLEALDLYADTFRAERDLLEAEALLGTLPGDSAATMQAKLEQLREEWRLAGGEEERS